MPAAFAKDILRTIRGNMKRFVAIVVITILGACMFSGLKAACDDLRVAADGFFDDQRLFDVRVLSTLGLTEADVDALSQVEGVSAAEGGYAETAYVTVDGKRASADVKALSPTGLNQPYVLEGQLPDSAGEVAVSSNYLAESGKQLGDTLQLQDADDADAAVFERRDYTITASVIDPMEVNNPDGSMSFRSSTSSDYSFFVTADDVLEDAADTFTVAYVRVDGADALRCYGSTYEDAVGQVEGRISDIADAREQARTDEVVADAEAQADDGEAEAQEGFAQAEAAFSDAQAEIDDGRAQLESGQAEIDAGWDQLAAGQAEIDANRQELVDGQAQLDAGQAQLDSNRAELQRQQDAYDQALPDAQAQISDGRAQIEAGVRAARDAATAAMDERKDQIVALLMAQGMTQQQALAAFEQQRAQAADEAEQAARASDELQAAQAQLDQAQQQLDDGAAQLAQAWAQLDAGQAELDARQQQINDGWAQLQAGQDQLNAGIPDLQAGQAQIDSGLAELESGQAELDEQRADYEQRKADALAEIADARAQVADIEPATWYVQNRTSLSGYGSIESDANSIEALGTAFPIIFLVVAVLVSLTAITRLVEEQRGLIGTYKSLGYAKHQVYAKYLIYALSACLIGGILGDACGFVALPAFLFTVFDVMYVLPGYPLMFDPVSGLAGVLIFVVAIGGSALLACRGEIRQTPAELLRPKAPKFGSRIFLERIRPLWLRLSFLNKVTARNLFRYKKRFFMTVAGIMGCTALIVCGFVIKDSVALMAPRQYEAIDLYDIMAVASGDDLQQQVAKLQDDGRVSGIQQVLIDSGEARNGSDAVDAQIIVVPENGALDGYVSLFDADGEPLALTDDGAVLTRNAADVLGLAAGDDVTVQDSSLEQRDVRITGIAESYLGNCAYMTQAAYESAFGAGSFRANGVLLQLEPGQDGAAFADELSQDAAYVSVVSTQELEDSFASSFALINTVVAVILLMAAALAFVVLFTLSTTNISERERELATIKVLGFRRREVHHYVNKETLILTGIGIACGLVAGPPLGALLLNSLNMPGIAFPVHIEWYSMIVCAVLPFAFALIVDAITNRTLDRIDMIGALKSVE